MTAKQLRDHVQRSVNMFAPGGDVSFVQVSIPMDDAMEIVRTLELYDALVPAVLRQFIKDRPA